MVTLIFAQIPITTWLLGRYIKSDMRSRAVSVEYVLSLGMGSAAVLLISLMHKAGYGFDIQFLVLAVSASITLCAAFFLPNEQSRPKDSEVQV